jgi:hypothetical protein
LSDGLAFQLRLRPPVQAAAGRCSPRGHNASVPADLSLAGPAEGRSRGVRLKRLAWLVGSQFGFLERAAEGERRRRVKPILSPERSVHDRPRRSEGPARSAHAVALFREEIGAPAVGTVELGIEATPHRGLVAVFTELAVAI